MLDLPLLARLGLHDLQDLVLRRVEGRDRDVLVGGLLGLREDRADRLADEGEVRRLHGLVARVVDYGCLAVLEEADGAVLESLRRPVSVAALVL